MRGEKRKGIGGRVQNTKKGRYMTRKLSKDHNEKGEIECRK